MRLVQSESGNLGRRDELRRDVLANLGSREKFSRIACVCCRDGDSDEGYPIADNPRESTGVNLSLGKSVIRLRNVLLFITSTIGWLSVVLKIPRVPTWDDRLSDTFEDVEDL